MRSDAQVLERRPDHGGAPGSPSTTLHQRLRQATRAAHDRVELTLGLDAMTADLRAYGHALAIVEASLSAAIGALLAEAYEIESQHTERLIQRRAALLADLHDLGRSPATPAPTFTLNSPSEALGCFYVVEGSALGGVVIYRTAQTKLGVTAEHAGRYFHGLGRQTGRVWSGFVANLNRTPAFSPQGDAAVRGAIETFDLYERSIADADPRYPS